MMVKRRTQIWVEECPLMVEDDAAETYVTLAFCQDCEYHKGFTLLEVDCGTDPIVSHNMTKSGAENTNKEGS